MTSSCDRLHRQRLLTRHTCCVFGDRRVTQQHSCTFRHEACQSNRSPFFLEAPRSLTSTRLFSDITCKAQEAGSSAGGGAGGQKPCWPVCFGTRRLRRRWRVQLCPLSLSSCSSSALCPPPTAPLASVMWFVFFMHVFMPHIGCADKNTGAK